MSQPTTPTPAAVPKPTKPIPAPPQKPQEPKPAKTKAKHPYTPPAHLTHRPFADLKSKLGV